MSAKAERSEYFSTNAMGQVVCRLCDTMHRDEANFAVHLTGKRHTDNLKIIARRKEMLAQEAEINMKLAKDAANERKGAAVAEGFGAEGAAALAAERAAASKAAGAATAIQRRNNVGPPDVRMQVDAIGTNQMHSRITFTVSYPLAGTGIGGDSSSKSVTADGATVTTAAARRPMHRWLSSYEQSVEPRDASKQYLVFACEPYQSVAYCFPTNVMVSTRDNTDPRDIQSYFCRWDPVEKTYLLTFTVTHK